MNLQDRSHGVAALAIGWMALSVLAPSMACSSSPTAGAPTSPSELVDAIDEYYTCRAFVTDNPNPCRGETFFEAQGIRHKTSGESISLMNHCSIDYYEMALVRALAMKDPKAADICVIEEQIDPPSERMFLPGMATQGCAALSRTAGDSHAICEALRPYLPKRHECVLTVRFLTGEEDHCERQINPLTRRRCEGFALFKKAFVLGDPALCGDSTVCRTLLTMDPEVCDLYIKKIWQLAIGG